LDNAGTPKKPPTVSPSDDIPIAFRETPTVASKPGSKKIVFWGSLIGLSIVALVAGGLVSLQLRQTQTVVASSDATTTNPATTPPMPSPTANDTLLGHFPYAEAPHSELAPIVDDGSILLRKSAAQAYRSMVAAARQEGITLVCISGFRSKTDQNSLFFDVKAERAQVATERAKVSAPPGYSEHHTGYAVDVGDGNVPAMNLNPNFDKTAAYRWLQANAARYSFEMSFPKNNRQGVSYEPWHWRYVGDIESLKLFYRARSLK
jgi:D-alanyl-D-alanine carboxypeptidase